MKKGIFIVLIAICAIVFGISAYNLISYYGKDRAAEREFAQLLPEEIGDADAVNTIGEKSDYEYMLNYYERLRLENNDIVGWLRIPGTRISYPVMQTKDRPEYYLDRNFNKEYSASGTLFADSKSDVDLPTDIVLIYGHRMKTGAMFGSLGDYLDPVFFEENDRIVFDTFTARNEYKIYSIFSIDVSVSGGFDYYNYTQFTDKDIFDYFMDQVHTLSDIENPAYKPDYGDKILLLSTCEYTHRDGRLVIVAVSI